MNSFSDTLKFRFNRLETTEKGGLLFVVAPY